jgi:hypothetical protein
VRRPAGTVARPAKELPEDPALRLNAVIGILNLLATDPQVVPTEENVRSPGRAALLLQDKLRSRLPAIGSSLSAVSPAGIRRPGPAQGQASVPLTGRTDQRRGTNARRGEPPGK